MKAPIPDILAELVQDGLIDKVDRGELVMKHLFTEAYDSASRTSCRRGSIIMIGLVNLTDTTGLITL
jgi:hypothetical protein